MRALVVTHLLPPVPQKDYHGIYRRLKMFVGAIAELCDAIDILHFVSADLFKDIDGKTLPAQSDYWGAPVAFKLVAMNRRQPHRLLRGLLPPLTYSNECCRLTGESQIAGLQACLSSAPDLIFVHRLPMTVPLLQLGRTLPPVFFDLDDVEHRVKVRAALNARSWRRLAGDFFQVPGIVAAERRAVRLSRKTFVCSEYDRRHLWLLGMGSNVVVAPNGVGGR